ncbi:MAG: hypothetical protein V1847_02485 [Candidatus Diapherotrites archaeon]
MAFNLFGKKEEVAPPAEAETEAESGDVKYANECSLCGKPGTEKKWMGQYWHKKCLRNARKFAGKQF